MLGALGVAQLQKKDAMMSDEQFFLILLACILVGSVFTAGLTYFLRRRSVLKQIREEEELFSEVEYRKGSTSTITLKTKTTKLSTVVTRHDVFFQPLPHRPPKVSLTNESDFDDPWAHDKLGDIMEDVFAKLLLKDFDELVARVREEVRKHAKGESDARFRLSAFRSEGPITPEGHCETGWTLYFVREDESHGCVAIVTRHELSMQFASTKEVELPYTLEEGQSTAPVEIAQLPDLTQVIELVQHEIPSTENHPLYVRGLSSNNVLVYTENAEAIAEVVLDDDGLKLTNGPQFAERLREIQAMSAERERWSFPDVIAWFRKDELSNEDLRALKESAGADVGFRSGDNVVFRRLGRGLHAFYGAKLTAALDVALNDALARDAVDEAKMLVRCLAFVPTMAAMARLHSFSQKQDERIRAVAADMFKARRKRLHSTEVDLLDHLNFPDLQRAKGFTRVDSIGVLTKSNDFRRDVLDRLARDLNLYVHRIRVITHRPTPTDNPDYSAMRDGLITAAWLRTKNGDCDVQINLIPVPRLVQYWYVSGSAAWSVLRDIRRMDQQYTQERLASTLRNIGQQFDDAPQETSRTRLSQQAPMLSTHADFLEAVFMLQVWDPAKRPPHAARDLMRAYRSDFTKNAWQLKQFIIDTLIFIRDTSPHTPADEQSEDSAAAIEAFLKDVQADERKANNRYHSKISRRIEDALDDSSLSQSSIFRPVLSMVKADIVPEEEDSDEGNITSETTAVMSTSMAAVTDESDT